MQSRWVPVGWGGIGFLVDGQAGPCMGWCMSVWVVPGCIVVEGFITDVF